MTTDEAIERNMREATSVGVSAISGRQIATARVMCGMSQGTLADLAQVSVATLRRIERRHGAIKGRRVDAIRSELENYVRFVRNDEALGLGVIMTVGGAR